MKNSLLHEQIASDTDRRVNVGFNIIIPCAHTPFFYTRSLLVSYLCLQPLIYAVSRTRYTTFVTIGTNLPANKD